MDPENDFLAFRISKLPANGKLSGTPPNVVYTANFGYIGKDSIEFEVIDGQAVVSTGTIGVTVKTEPVGVTVYDGFDYPPGDLNGKTGDASVGFSGSWTVGDRKNLYVVAEDSFGFEVP